MSTFRRRLAKCQGDRPSGVLQNRNDRGKWDKDTGGVTSYRSSWDAYQEPARNKKFRLKTLGEKQNGRRGRQEGGRRKRRKERGRRPEERRYESTHRQRNTVKEREVRFYVGEKLTEMELIMTNTIWFY